MRTGLDGRVGVVTGAASGIGRATACALAAEGCRVVAADLDADGLARLSQELPGMVEPWQGDIADPAAGGALCELAGRRFGGLDVLVTSAGVWDRSPLSATTDDDWARVLEVNLGATFRCARAAIAAMIPRGWGRVVTLSSIAARTGGGAAGPAYVASKAGVIGLTRSLANVAGPHGITVNCISPGPIDTPMIRDADPAQTRQTVERIPLRRLGTPEDVAAVIVMLCSEGAGYVHGAHLAVNGGLVME